MDKLKKIREKEKEFVGFKPKGFQRVTRMDVTRTGAFRDARELLKQGKPSVGIYWRPEKYTYFVTESLEPDWNKKGWQKILEIS